MTLTEQERTRIFGCKAQTPLRLSVCGQLLSPSGFLHHRRCFDYHVLIMVTEGTLYINADQVLHKVSAGQYIFLKAGEEHFGAQPSEGRLSYLWAHFKADAPVEDVSGITETEEYTYLFPETAHLADTGRTAQLFHQLMDFSLEQGAYSQKMSDYAVSLLLLEISQSCMQRKGEAEKLPKAVVAAREWIKNHYYQPFEVSQLAELVGYRADYLSSLFKRYMGVSIVRYANQIRIRTAKTLLSNYDVTIKEAAYSCGFSDEKYFMKVFKQTEGITPAQYRSSFNRSNVN